jgi:predicted small secreted protein
MKNEINDTYHEIAKAMSGDWSAEITSKPDWPRSAGKLKHKSGLTLFIQSGGYNLPEKHEISYLTPRDQKGHVITVYNENMREYSTPSIRVTQKKAPGQIAKDIERRLLEDAERVHNAAMQRLEYLKGYYKKEDEAKAAEKSLSYTNGVSFSANGGKIHVDGYVDIETAKAIHAILSGKA